MDELMNIFPHVKTDYEPKPSEVRPITDEPKEWHGTVDLTTGEVVLWQD